MGNAVDTLVFINNNSETNEVTRACCDKFKIELKPAQKIIKLLQEEKLEHAQSDRKYRRLLLASQREFTTIGNQKKGTGFM